jgi:hypothetical protein
VTNEIGAALCRTWGIDPNNVLAITIRFLPAELPTATLRVMLTEGVIRELALLRPVED